MTTLLQRLRSHTVVDTGDGLPELIEEAAREIERLTNALADSEQRRTAEAPYSSSDWSDDA